MSVIPKTEKNLGQNVPVSRPMVSIKSIIKDLQDLDKSLITKNQMDALNAQLIKLTKENEKMKSELETKDEKILRYKNLYHENLKELTEINAENEQLKAEIATLKTSTEVGNEISEVSISSIQAAVPVNDSRSEDEEDEPVVGTMLAVCDNDNVPLSELKKSSKRSLDDTEHGSTTKKTKINLQKPDSNQPWKCIICKSCRFETIEELRNHFTSTHPLKAWFCGRCPMFVANHERLHVMNDFKYGGASFAQQCEFCKICFGQTFALTAHLNMYH